ncbi:MAG TPA: magnesium/cobalt transporter CorA [Flavobacteriaceae bacterium]|nr:magnesium/cobalt transporter CorA [Flavobacteriaceae bacterium]
MEKKKRTSKYKTRVGLSPGTMVYTGKKENQPLFIECIDYTPKKLEVHEYKKIENTFHFKETQSITWININGLNHIESIEKIGKQHNIHPLVLEDIVNTNQRPKIDEYPDYIFIVLKMIYYNSDENIVIEQVSFILGNNYVLTFQETDGDVFESVRARLQNESGRIRNAGADYLFYALIDAVVDHYYVVAETLGNKVEDLEDEIFAGKVTDAYSKQIQILKRELLKVRRAIFPLREVINRIDKSENTLINKDNLQFFRDVYDHVIQLSDSIDIYREMTWSLMDMYMTSISNKMNEVMKVLTIIATIFIPLTFIVGVYGMNFDNMPELHYKNAYYIVWAVMILVFILMLFYFKRKKWL